MTTKMKITKKPRTDVHEQVTAQIIRSIEAGAGTWQMPWHNGGTALTRPANVDTKHSCDWSHTRGPRQTKP